MPSASGYLAVATAIAFAPFLSTGAVAQDIQSQPVEIRGGSATFEAATNLPAIKVYGKSEALEGRARIRKNSDGLVIERLEAVLPVRTLKTGLTLRDEHMRKYVFTTPDGRLRDMRFVAERASCSSSGSSVHTCNVSGDLIIRDVPRPFTISLKVNDDGGSLRAAGEAVVRLSTYDISPPSQLGVTTKDDVKLRMDFVVHRVPDQIARQNR
jgi:polyisoprenoid-binding protein YceI